MRNLLILGVLILFVAAPAMAQRGYEGYPKAEVSGDYQYVIFGSTQGVPTARAALAPWQVT
jgi:hypothetical protein